MEQPTTLNVEVVAPRRAPRRQLIAASGGMVPSDLVHGRLQLLFGEGVLRHAGSEAILVPAGNLQLPAGNYVWEVVDAAGGPKIRTAADDVADMYRAAVRFMKAKGILGQSLPHNKAI